MEHDSSTDLKALLMPAPRSAAGCAQPTERTEIAVPRPADPTRCIESGERWRAAASSPQAALYMHCRLEAAQPSLVALQRHGIEGVHVAGAINWPWSREVMSVALYEPALAGAQRAGLS